MIALFLALLLIAAGTSTADATPVNIAADSLTRSGDGVVTASGHVVITRANDTVRADRVIYRTQQHILEADGHVIITSERATIHAIHAIMQTESNTGQMRDAEILLPNGERLKAAQVRRIDDQQMTAEQVIFTACPVDDEAWRIRARHALIDQQQGSVTTTDSRFEVYGVPLLYTPWWQQPLKRKSGLLLPTIGFGKRRGTEIATPYYYAPAPNWDATFTPHLMSARGLMAESELRHVSPLGAEQLNLDAIHDRVTANNRSRLRANIHWQLPAASAFDLQADHVSDRDYLADFGSGNSNINSSYLTSTATLSQQWAGDQFSGSGLLQAQHQQNTVLTSNATVLQILPRAESRMQWQQSPNLRLHLDQQTTRFDRRQGVDGWRVDLHPYLEMPWQLAGGGLSTQLAAGSHYTYYALQQNAAQTNNHPHRSSAEISLETRADFERISSDRRWRHTISPIIRYDWVNAPADQSQLPNFDAAFARLTWNSLMSANRFSGYDRIERTNRISLLLENRLQSKAGQDKAARDRLVVRAGLSYDMLRRSVDPTLQPAPTRPFSNLLGEVIANPLEHLRLYGNGQYDSANHYWATITANAAVTLPDDNALTLGYTSTDARYALAARLFDLDARWHINRAWETHARWEYDLRQKRSQNTTIGLHYRHACWGVQLQAYRYNRTSNTSSSANIGYMISFEFKGLG